MSSIDKQLSTKQGNSQPILKDKEKKPTMPSTTKQAKTTASEKSKATLS
jgi:hypothetical protein